jgi:hypothetical protein
MIHKFKLKNRFEVILITDKKTEEYYILSDNHKQYIKGKFPDTKERTHLPFCIRDNQYSLVIDPNDDQKEWESWSVFDEKNQSYIETAQGVL